MLYRSSASRGMALVEIVIGAAILTMGFLAISTAYTTYMQYALANQHNTEATYLLVEGQEVASLWRNKGWSVYIAPLSTTTAYYLYWTGGTWQATTTPQYVDGFFLRTVTLNAVTRDGNDDIASSGTYDQNTRKITVSVSYVAGHATTTQSLVSYLMNI